MSMFGVSADKERRLYRRMVKMDVSEDELKENFIRASGPGGQKVNKTAVCVYLKHIPTGIEVKCQKERSRALNRFLARRRMLDLIEKKRKGYIEKEQKRIAKIRRQKRKRSKRAKEKMLEYKHKRSEKKNRRGKIKPHDLEE